MTGPRDIYNGTGQQYHAEHPCPYCDARDHANGECEPGRDVGGADVTTPHTEPESLAAWAKRTAPTLDTDEDWRHVRLCADGKTEYASVLYGGGRAGCFDEVECRALLAELDRLWGSLIYSQRRMLTKGRFDATSVKGLRDRGIATRESGRWELTDLGRAVLARKAAQR